MKIHLSAICGTAMGSLAGLLQARGHQVSGSDQDVYPPMSDQLAAMGVPIRSPYAEENVPPDAELVVLGNALSRGNPEVEVVLDRKQRMASMPAVLAEEFLRDRTSVVVAGTHGKTTTTSMLAFLLTEGGLDPSFLVGGVPVDFERSWRLGKGEHFVVEGDEYDSAFFDKRPKFIHYRPDVAVLGNVEYDHADIYPDLAAVTLAFRRLLQVIPRRGRLLVGVDSAGARQLAAEAFCPVETFGLSEGCDWRAVDVGPGEDGWRFRVLRQDRDAGTFTLQLPGEHNVRNALAAVATAVGLGVDLDAARAALTAFRGVKRRLEVRGVVAGVTVYDDFAHHPTAVRETLAALRRTTGRGRLMAVFEPRSYTSRTRVFQEEFARALGAADLALVAAAHLPAKVPSDQRVSEAELVGAINAGGGQGRFVESVDAIVEVLAREARAGDHVVVLSNGGFGGIHEKLLAALGARPAAS
jgi:UDP-N-acetylmuramate: L-alanyl-gamma-D-glutamyl-meso-diaminopimelate ligase